MLVPDNWTEPFLSPVIVCFLKKELKTNLCLIRCKNNMSIQYFLHHLFLLIHCKIVLTLHERLFIRIKNNVHVLGPFDLGLCHCVSIT